MKQSVSNPCESLWFSSSLRPSINVLTPGFNLAPAVGWVPIRTRKLPDLRFSVLELHWSLWGRAAGGRLCAIGGASEAPPPGAAPRPSEAGPRDYAKSHCPAPRPDWRPLFAAQLQETTPRGSGQQVRPGEGLTVGLGRVPAPRLVSVSLSR